MAGAATGGYVPPLSEISPTIPVELLLTTPAKILASALWVSNRSYDEALANSAFIGDAISTAPSFITDVVEVHVDHSAQVVTMTVPLTTSTVPSIVASYRRLYPTLKTDWDAEHKRLLALGSVARSARFCGDQGCHIVPTSGAGPYFVPTAVDSKLPPASTMDWPMGDRRPKGSPVPNHGQWAAAADAAFSEASAHTAAFIVLHRGDIVCERYAPGFGINSQLESWSMGKSITATMIGQLLHEGTLCGGNIDSVAPIPAWHKDPADPRGSITLRHLLQMSSGLKFSGFDTPRPEWKHGRPDHVLPYSEAVDCFEWAVSRPAEHAPGTVGRYRNCDPLTLGFLVRMAAEAAGEDYLSYPQKTLFDQIGIRKQVLETDLWGNFILTGFDYGTARGWARLGLLYQQNGFWQATKQRLLSKEFVDFVGTPAPAWPKPVYGGQFWVNGTQACPALPPSAFSMRGAGGQSVTVDRSNELVVVRLGHRRGDRDGAAGRTLNNALSCVVAAIGRARASVPEIVAGDSGYSLDNSRKGPPARL